MRGGIHMKKKTGSILVMFFVLCIFSFIFSGVEKGIRAAEELQIPPGVKVAGSPEVMPSENELRAAMLPSLKKLGKGKTIHILFQAGGDSDTPNALQKFIEKEVGMKIVFDIVPPQQMHEREVMSFMSGSYEYDLIECYPTYIGEYAEADFIHNLDKWYTKYAKEIDVTDYIEGAQVGFDKYKGSWYAIPYDGDVLVLYYRSDLLNDTKNKNAFKKKYGYNLGAPETWDQVRDIAEFFTETYPDMKGMGFLAGKDWLSVDYWLTIYRNYLTAKNIPFKNGLVNDFGEIELNKDAFITANEVWLSLLKLAPEDILSWGYSECKEAIGSGRIPMTMQWASSVFRDPRQTKYWNDITATVMPGFKKADGKVNHVTSLAVGKAMVVPKLAKNAEVAFLYASYLSTKTVQIYETNSGSGVDPNRHSVWKDKRVQEVWGPLFDPTQKSLGIGIGDIKVPQASKLYEAILIPLHSSWSGDIDSEEAYEETIAEFEKIMAK
jgi:multiple sugar transport system substrate-binding protein